jgi:hypothetical protein
MHVVARAAVGFAKVLLWAAVVLVAIPLSAWAHLASDDGRHLFSQALAGWITEAIPGSMTIEGMPHLTTDRVVLEGVVVREPGANSTVLDVHWVELEPVLADLVDGTIHLRKLRVRGARLWMKKPPDDRVGIARAFAPPPDADGEAGGGPDVLLGPIHLQDVHAFFEMGDHSFEIRHIQGFMSIQIREDERIQFDRMSGTFHPPKGPVKEVPFEDMRGRVHVQAERMATFEGIIRLADSAVGAQVTYFDREEPPMVQIDLQTEGLSKGAWLALGFGAASKFLPEVQGSVSLSGDLDALRPEPTADE